MARASMSLLKLPPHERGPHLAAVIEDLYQSMHRKETDNLKFLCDYELEKILERYTHPLFDFEEWTAQQIRLIISRCRQIFATLLLSGAFTCSQLRSIRDLFFRQDDPARMLLLLNDDNLLFESELEVRFLPPTIRHDFLAKQYMLKPYRFKEQIPNKPLQVALNARLPFKSEEVNIGEGGYGTVSKVCVAYKYLVRADGFEYTEDQHCALKRIQANRHFMQEVRQLQILKESLTKHEHVLRHYVSFTHGETFNILLPLAKHGSLEVLLRGGFDPTHHEEVRVYDFAKEFPHFDSSKPKALHDLVTQFSHIADAVKWMHGDISGGVLKDAFLIHMDLKPANILVMEDTSHPLDRSWVGVWKISDFGISVMKSGQRQQQSQRPHVYTIGDAAKRSESRNSDRSRTHVRRPSGVYQAPEIELGDNSHHDRFGYETDPRGHAVELHRHPTMGRKSDVWSLACILCEVVAFGLGGRNSVLDFQNVRKTSFPNDYFYCPTESHSLRATPAPLSYRLRPAVVEWLDSLAAKYKGRGEWVRCCMKIVREALKCNINERIDAATFNEQLKHSREHYNDPNRYGGHRCTFLQKPLPPSPSQNSLASSHQRSSSIASDAPSGTDMSLRSPPQPLEHMRSLQPVPTLDQKLLPLFSMPSNRAKPSKATCISVCPSGRGAIFLMNNYLQYSPFEPVFRAPGQLPLILEPIPLQDNVRWEKVELANEYVCVLGKRKSGGKVVAFFNLLTQKPMPALDNSILNFVRSIAVSAIGIAILNSHNKLLMLDLRDETNACQELSAIANYNFSEIAFSPTGETLVAWAYGQQLDDTIFYWRFDQFTREIIYSGNYRFPTSHAGRSGIGMIMVAPARMDAPIDCIVRESYGSFFAARLIGPSGTLLERRPVALEKNEIQLVTMFSNSHLIALQQKRRKGQAISFQLNFTQSVKLYNEKTVVDEFESFESPIQLRTVAREDGPRLLIMGLDTRLRRAKVELR